MPGYLAKTRDEKAVRPPQNQKIPKALSLTVLLAKTKNPKSRPVKRIALLDS